MTKLAERHIDRDEIIQLAWKYAKFVDTLRNDKLVDLFAPDATFSFAWGKSLQGTDAIRAYLAPPDKKTKWAPGGITHVMSNVVVDFEDDDDRATGRVTGIAYLNIDDVILTRGLHYDDSYVRTEKGWLFASRAHNCDWQYEIPASKVSSFG